MKERGKNPNPPALILGSGVTALGALRALAEAGKSCFVAPPGADLVSDSRWYRPAPGSADFKELGATPDSIRRIGLDTAVLLPCSDSTSLAVARLAAEGSDRLYSCTNTEETILLFQDKQRFADLLTELAVPQPLTVVVESAGDLDVLDAGDFSQAFLKPADSQSFMAHYGVKAFWVGDKSEAIDRWRMAHEQGFETVLQEYVAGDASDHYYIDGFVDSKGRICGQLARRRLRIYPPDFGNSTLMVSVPLEDLAQASDSLAKIFEATSYKGIFSAEFKQDANSGVFKLLEINARAWWYLDFVRRCGVDVCNMAYDDALGRPVEIISSYAVGKRCVYPYYDYFAYREAGPDGFIPFIKWFWQWIGALQPVFRLTDPMPATLATARILTQAIRCRFGGRS